MINAKEHKEEVMGSPSFKNSKNAERKKQIVAVLDGLIATEDWCKDKSMVRASLYQLFRDGQGFSLNSLNKDMPHRKNCLVEVEHLLEVNSKALEAGKLYIIDQEATKETLKIHGEWMKETEQQRKEQEAVGAEVRDVLKNIGKAAKSKVAAAGEQEAVGAEEESEELKEAKAELEAATAAKNKPAMEAAKKKVAELTPKK